MSFMQKNINLFLLGMVLVVALTLAGSAIYYQKTFDKMTTNYDETSANLSSCRSDLDSYKFNLNKTLRSLNTTAQDIRRYDELYSTKATQLQETTTTLNETASELQETKISLQEESALKNKYKQDYNDQLEISRNLEEQNAILTSQKAQLEASVISYRTKIEASQECIAQFLDDYDAGLTSAMKADVDECAP
jgi:chromosome segregation ATPase